MIQLLAGAIYCLLSVIIGCPFLGLFNTLFYVWTQVSNLVLGISANQSVMADEECCICFESMTIDDVITLDPCGHRFHHGCIK